jgi:hypothetical protein
MDKTITLTKEECDLVAVVLLQAALDAANQKDEEMSAKYRALYNKISPF